MAHLGCAVVEQHVVADRIAATGIAHECDSGRARSLPHGLDRSGELPDLILRGRAAYLRFGVTGAGERVGKVECGQTIARDAIGLEAPRDGEPERSMVAVAVQEQDGRQGYGASALRRSAPRVRCA